MVQIFGCGMDTIMGHDQKRLPSRILAYSPQEDFSSLFTLLASLYPNRFSTLGFLQATLSRESPTTNIYDLAPSPEERGQRYLLFAACPCQGRLFVSLFVSQPPKKLGAWGGASVRATSVKLLLVSLPLAGYLVSWFLSLFVSSFLSLFCLLVSLFVCFTPKEKMEASGGASVRATSVKLLLVSLPLARYLVSWFLSLFVSLFCHLSPSSALMYIVSWFLSWFLPLFVSHPKKSWRRRGALQYALLASSCYLCPCLLQATLSLGFSRGCPR